MKKNLLITIFTFLSLLIIFNGNIFGQDTNNDFALGTADAGCFRVDDNAALDVTGDFSIGMWVMASVLPNQARLLSKYDSSSTFSYELALYNDGKFRCSFSSTGSDTGGAINAVVGNTVVIPEQWYYVMAIHSKTEFIIINQKTIYSMIMVSTKIHEPAMKMER